jgi:hypothetical protein
MNKVRDVPGTGAEVAVDDARGASGESLKANKGLVPSSSINPATGTIDPSRARWSRARWSDATELLRARWSSASFVSAPLAERAGTEGVDPSRARWSRARWSASFTK